MSSQSRVIKAAPRKRDKLNLEDERKNYLEEVHVQLGLRIRGEERTIFQK